MPRPILPRRYWTKAEDRIILTCPPAEAARLTGRTVQAVHGRRHKLEAL